MAGMKKELPLLHQQVLGLIPSGDRSITFCEIIQTLGLSKQHERDIRQVLVDLVMKYGYRIGSASGGSKRKGFFLIETVGGNWRRLVIPLPVGSGT
ncbi:hypothetical protein SAMN05444673_6987 [Bacillus sp. OV166]|uniref:hypothetical protein n=1 Tax=Bacillus sp. OV166 TaxID=1882763 RepID=UPI000A2ACA6B|nr:hypothetical protein [Bacillus sp. OV166]SMQ86906.1 hypothetical protein SAMN05444673_6987 [Bacillus sp. OV166]